MEKVWINDLKIHHTLRWGRKKLCSKQRLHKTYIEQEYKIERNSCNYFSFSHNQIRVIGGLSVCVCQISHEDLREKIITVLLGQDLLLSESSTSSISSFCYKNKETSEANLLVHWTSHGVLSLFYAIAHYPWCYRHLYSAECPRLHTFPFLWYLIA